MTTPKVNTIRREGSRLYVHAETGEKVPGVTSVLNMLPKPFLQYWGQKVVAEAAVDQLPAFIHMAMNGDREGAIDYLKRAPQRNTGKAADTGTAAHDLFETMARGDDLGRVHPDMQGFVDGYQAFLDAFQPEFLHLEETIWSDKHGYAGSFDAIAIIDGETVILDNKTTRSGVHAEVALQLAAYANGDYILNADGSTVPLPSIDAAAVVHVRPDSWGLYPVSITEEVFAHFLPLLDVYHWDKKLKKNVIGKPLLGLD